MNKMPLRKIGKRQRKRRKAKLPNRAEIESLMRLMPERIIKHNKAVTAYAMIIGKQLKENGAPVDLDYLKSICLVHDIRKVFPFDHSKAIGPPKYPTHGEAAGRILKSKHFKQIAKSVAVHTSSPKKAYLPYLKLEEKILLWVDGAIEETRVYGLQATLDVLSRTPKSNVEKRSRIKRHFEVLKKIGNEFEQFGWKKPKGWI